MKLLILTAWYHPFIHPRAHRWTVLAEHWAAAGHSVVVLTARAGDVEKEPIINGVQVHRVGFDSLKEWVYYWMRIQQGRGRVGVTPKRPGRWTRFLEWLYKVVWKSIFFPDDACLWYLPAKRKLFHLLETGQFDGLITVSLPFTGHVLGLAAKRRFPNLFWLADVGDPFSVQAKPPNNSRLFHRTNMRLERRVLDRADAVTVTTVATVRWYRDLFGVEATQKMAVIPPLFYDKSKETNLAVTTDKTEALVHGNTNIPKLKKLGYFGSLYSPTRTPDAFLDLYDRTLAFRPEIAQQLEVHFFGEIFPEFYQKMAAHAAIRLHGLCSRAASWEAMQTMDLLLNIGNTTDFQLPSKAVDYLASGKPIVHLSYVENDPFVEFFKGTEMLFQINVRDGIVADKNLVPWIDWLESANPPRSLVALQTMLQPFQAASIADQYLRFFCVKAPE